MASHDETGLFVQLSENRLQQSLNRLTAMDSRALGLLGLVAVLMTGLWAVFFSRRPSSLMSPREIVVWVALGFLCVALVTAGWSLIMAAKFDNPNLAALYSRYYAKGAAVYPAYFAAVIAAIQLNDRISQRKANLLLITTLSIFCSVLIIII